MISFTNIKLEGGVDELELVVAEEKPPEEIPPPEPVKPVVSQSFSNSSLSSYHCYNFKTVLPVHDLRVST